VRSLRARLLVGAALWTIGLVGVTNIVVLALLHRFPGPIAHVGAMSVVGLGLLLAGLAQVRTGLRPLVELRARLVAVRQGRAPRVAGRYPAEVEPLVEDLNALLGDREASVARAQAQAGDLAHGLKTPLAVLAQEAERVARAGHPELGTTIAQQVERMRRQMDFHLAHARAAASGARLGARCSVAESVEGLVRTLERLHAERGLVIEASVADELAVRCQRQEMLGNLLDNACRWARRRVTVAASVAGERVVLRVDDDGPGLAPSLRDAVLQRGMRADESAGGSGLGLAIVRELAELHGGSIGLEGSPAGGLRARLELPSC
jgi:signal transduction histidine kinase